MSQGETLRARAGQPTAHTRSAPARHLEVHGAVDTRRHRDVRAVLLAELREITDPYAG